MFDDRFDIHEWRSKFIYEEEGGNGDEKLDKLIASLTSNVGNLSSVLATFPEYVGYIMNPNDPANKPEHNKVNVETAKDALRDTEQYLAGSQEILKLLKSHIKEKYNFEG